MQPSRLSDRTAVWLFFGVIVGIAFLGPRGDSRSWNDASRLATVESLVDHHTLAIDHSSFERHTYDKIRVDGHFYSDKPPVPALWQALVYALMQLLFGLQATDFHLFCYVIGVGSSGLAYTLGTAGIYRLGRNLDLSPRQSLMLAGAFAFATLAPVYIRNVNSHILQLAAACWLMAGLIPALTMWRAVCLGMLAGLAYTIDLGVGPVLLMGSGLYVWWKGSYKCAAVFTLGALPFFVLHHAINYAIGGTIVPAAMMPEFFAYEGSKFSRDSLTGNWTHPDLEACLRYGISLLIGERGFLSFQPVLWLVPVGLVALIKRRVPELPLLGLAAFWCAGTWLAYTLFSNNHSGYSCSIRWFMPLLAPCFFVIALTLRYAPGYWPDLGVLAAWGLVLVVCTIADGPWASVNPAVVWNVDMGAIVSWIALRVGLWIRWIIMASRGP